MQATLPCWGGRKHQLEILKGISGIFRPGVLTALVGVSGAGKTTLLDILAGRKTSAALSLVALTMWMLSSCKLDMPVCHSRSCQACDWNAAQLEGSRGTCASMATPGRAPHMHACLAMLSRPIYTLPRSAAVSLDIPSLTHYNQYLLCLLGLVSGARHLDRVEGKGCVGSLHGRAIDGDVTPRAVCQPQATVHEALMFSASLRMASSIPRKVRVAFVEEVHALTPCAKFWLTSAHQPSVVPVS